MDRKSTKLMANLSCSCEEEAEAEMHVKAGYLEVVGIEEEAAETPAELAGTEGEARVCLLLRRNGNLRMPLMLTKLLNTLLVSKKKPESLLKKYFDYR